MEWVQMEWVQNVIFSEFQARVVRHTVDDAEDDDEEDDEPSRRPMGVLKSHGKKRAPIQRASNTKPGKKWENTFYEIAKVEKLRYLCLIYEI